MSKIKLLPKRFEGLGEIKGKLFEKDKASKYTYMYRVGDKDSADVYYEIFKRKVSKLYGKEIYPSSHQFGIWAFTTKSRKRALAIFRQLQNKQLKTIK